MNFIESKPEQLIDNPFKLIGKDWMLITAGTQQSFNTMTASWGGVGVLWQKQVSFCFVRPTRYTFEFMERSENFTLSFFEERYRKELNFCGSNSGRDTDKVKETGLTPISKDGFIYFGEARLVLACRKLYFQDINPGYFLEQGIHDLYPAKDYHRMYVGEIVSCLKKGS